MANSIINALPGNQLGKYQRVTGTYTTAEWVYGSSTCETSITKPGLYLVFASFTLADTKSVNRASYKQLQIQTNGTNILQNNLYQDQPIAASDTAPMVTRTICCPILITQENQYIRPYVHTATPDLVYNIAMAIIELT